MMSERETLNQRLEFRDRKSEVNATYTATDKRGFRGSEIVISCDYLCSSVAVFRPMSNETRSLYASVGDAPVSSYQQSLHQRCRVVRSSIEKSADAGKRLTISRSSS